MTERPYIWHESKFPPYLDSGIPWSVSLGRPKDAYDYVTVTGTLEEAMAEALKLVPKEVP